MLTLTLLTALTLAREPIPQLLVRPDAIPAQARILDARSPKEYLAGHVPGAVGVDLAAWSEAVDDAKDRAGWAKRLAEVGLTPTSTAVVYADDVRDAARLWWILKYVGANDVRLLDGGWKTYNDGKRPVETDRPKFDTAVATAEWKAAPERLATKADVLKELKGQKAVIIDARSDGEFCGTKAMAAKNGHIPGAVALEWKDLIDPKTTQFKPEAELRKMVADRKIDLSAPIVTYCQSGGRAAVVAFGMELLGAQNVRDYYKSWSEWGNAEDTPVEKSPAKK